MDWAYLPEGILNLILSNLFPNDRKTFGLVCRSWNVVVKSCPWLMFYEKDEEKWKLVQANGVDKLYRAYPKLSCDAEVRCSKYGWLLMSRDDFSLFFFDPSNSTTLEVPRMDYYYTTICFFHPPTSPHCFVFAMANLMEDLTCKTLKIGMVKRGENRWTSYTFGNTSPFFGFICTPVLHRGLLYCLDQNGNIATLNINGQFSPCTSWTVYTNCLLPPRVCYNTIKQHSLFKINGNKSIFGVFVEHDEGKVNVFRLLEPKMKWDLVEDLGDNMLFVSHSGTFAETAPNKSMANMINFRMFQGDKGVFYSLDTRKYHSLEGVTNTTFYDFTQLQFATWFTPRPMLQLHEQLNPWHQE